MCGMDIFVGRCPAPPSTVNPSFMNNLPLHLLKNLAVVVGLVLMYVSFVKSAHRAQRKARERRYSHLITRICAASTPQQLAAIEDDIIRFETDLYNENPFEVKAFVNLLNKAVEKRLITF